MVPMQRFAIFFSFLFLLANSVQAATPSTSDDDKPFANQHVVLQLSDSSPARQTLVLNVAGNLLKYYGSDSIDLEVVAFGPGLQLLLANNKNAGRINSLKAEGVRFSACGNTLAGLTARLGHAPKLNPAAQTVPAGVVRILELEKKGYSLLIP